MKTRDLLLVSLFLSGFTAPLAAARQEGVVREPSRARVELARLLRELRDRERIGDPELVRGMRIHAPGEVDFLLDVLEQRSVPGFGTGAAQILSVYQEELVLATLGDLGRARVVDLLRPRLVESPGPAQRRLAVGVLGAVGGRSDLHWLLSLAAGPPESPPSPALLRTLESAVKHILEREPEGLRELAAARRQLAAPVLDAVLTALGDLGSSAALGLVVEVVHFFPPSRGHALAQVPKLGLSTDATVNQEARLRVRAWLDPNTPMICRSAALAAASLRDFDALPELIELLSAEDPGLRQTTLAALRQLTGKRLPADLGRWKLWYDREQRWLHRERAFAFRKLRSYDAAEVVEALGEIAQHPTVREDFLLALRDLLQDRRPEMRVLASETLAELDAVEALEDLTTVALADPSAEVVQAASAALARLTGPGRVAPPLGAD